MASPTLWPWVWASSESWWWTGRPGVLQAIRSQRVGHDWVTELIWMALHFLPNPIALVMPYFLFSTHLISFKQFMPGLGYTGGFNFSFVWRCLALRTKPLTVSLCSPQLDHYLLKNSEQYTCHLFLYFSKICSFKEHTMSS